MHSKDWTKNKGIWYKNVQQCHEKNWRYTQQQKLMYLSPWKCIYQYLQSIKKNCIRTFNGIQLGVSIYLSFESFKKRFRVSSNTVRYNPLNEHRQEKKKKKSIAMTKRKNIGEKNTSHVKTFVTHSTWNTERKTTATTTKFISIINAQFILKTLKINFPFTNADIYFFRRSDTDHNLRHNYK